MIGKLGLIVGGIALALAIFGAGVSIAGPGGTTPTGDDDTGLMVVGLGI